MGQGDSDSGNQNQTGDDTTKTTGAGSTDDSGNQNQDGTDKGKSTQDDDLSGLKKALAAARKERDELAKQKRDAELAKLPELERAKAEAAELAKENDSLKTENLRMKIGMQLGLPWNIAKRITGDDEQAMREDAADLLKDFKHDQSSKDSGSDKDKVNRKPPTNDARKTGGTGKQDMNFLLRRAAGRG